MIPKGLIFAIAAALALFSCIYETSQATSTAESNATATALSGETASTGSGAEKNKCGENEMETECQPICELQCGKPPTFCPAICYPGDFCTCEPDTCRNECGKCVQTNGTEHVCPKNETYTDCEPICDPICGEDAKPCPKICKLGHFCKCASGFCRVSKTGHCIKNCPKNEVFTQYKPLCEPKCGEKPQACPLVLIPGAFCTCESGYCRDEISGDCIKNCPNDEQFTPCKPFCEPKCGQKINPLTCPRICIRGAYCICEPELCRDLETGRCIKECPEHERYTECEPLCETKCGDEPRLCKLVCIPGKFCTCVKQYCRNHKGVCVKDETYLNNNNCSDHSNRCDQ